MDILPEEFSLLAAFSGNLHRRRRIKGFSQAELARRSGLTQAGISELEQRRRVPTLAAVARLSEALGIAGWRLLQPQEKSSLSRDRSDKIAQFIVGSLPAKVSRSISAQERELANQVGALVIQKLRAHHVPGRIRYARSRWRVIHRRRQLQQRFGEEAVRQVLRRVDALLAMGVR